MAEPAAEARPATILHVDMDAFFASVEVLVDPSLRNKPVIVGGDGARGVVASCSYEARYYGVRSAMPSSRAKRLCPQAIFVQGRYDLYEQYSRRMHAVFERFTPLVEGLSLDEAFLQVGGAQRLFGPASDIAWQIRQAIQDDLGLTASVGVASTKHIAKLASVAAKPKASKRGPVDAKGVVVVPDAAALDFLHPLPVRAIWGVGPKSADRLATIGITTVGELARTSIESLEAKLGKATAQHLHNLAWNRDDREVEVAREAKSIGHEQTFARDLTSRSEVHDQFVRLADAVTTRMRKNGSAGRTLTVKIRYNNFETITRSRTLPKATSNAPLLVKTADAVSEAVDFDRGVRLVGLSVSNLENDLIEEQLSLGGSLGGSLAGSLDGLPSGASGADESDEPEPEDLQLDVAIDAIRARFGDAAVVPGLLVSPDGPKILKQGERQWGPSKVDEK